MAKKLSASSAQGKATKKSAKHTSDKKIDYSDIPASNDEELKINCSLFVFLAHY